MKYDSVQQFNSVERYIMQMRPILRKPILFSDGTADYRIPPEPKAGEKVRIRFRTAANNVDLVLLCHGDERLEMAFVECDRDFDYYETEIQIGEERYGYHFEVISGMVRCCYDRAGVAREYRPQYEFVIIPGFSTPDWAKGAVMYQIFTDRFCNGDKTNDVVDGEYYYINRLTKKVENWEKYPENFDVANFYGGDLAGVISKLDYLQDLGVEVIYFNPLFVSASSHKYDTQDYDYIDPHLGVILEDGGEPMWEGCSDNRQASIYKKRVTSKKKSGGRQPAFYQAGGGKLTGEESELSLTVYLITAVPLISGLTGKKSMRAARGLNRARIFWHAVQRGAAAGGTVVLKAGGVPDDTGASADANGHGAVKTAPYKAPVYGRP